MSTDAGPTGNPGGVTTAAGETGDSDSPRLALAHVAQRTVRAMRGVDLFAGLHMGWSTVSGAQAVRGVAVIAQADGTYELDVHVVVAWPVASLHGVAADLRGRIRDAAQRRGLATLVGEIDVSVEDLDLGEEDA